MFNSLTRRVLEPPAVGIDVSDLTIKFIRLSRRMRSGGAVLDYFGEVEIPPGVVVDGEIKKEADLAAILKKHHQMSNGELFRERYCVAALPEEKSFVRVLELPNLKDEDVPNAVRWEVEGVVPLPFSEIFFDFEITPVSSPEHRDVLITAFPRAIVESYHRVFLQAGLLPLALELESQAISRALIPASSYLDSVIIIDVGANRTSFIIFAGGSLVFTKSIAVGGHDFESAIAARLEVTPDEAKRIKIEAGLNKNYHDGEVLSSLTPHLRAIVNELEQQLRFYRDHPRKRDPEIGDIQRIVLCGGDANLIGMERFIATSVKRQVVIGDPFANLHLAPGMIPPIPKNESLKYTTAIGLALRAIGL